MGRSWSILNDDTKSNNKKKKYYIHRSSQKVGKLHVYRPGIVGFTSEMTVKRMRENATRTHTHTHMLFKKTQKK